uniref:hAT-like transposase RNase-H fold domain-containing protein n=1 Tax=Arundo donax TaxID=35708 RepID=A0A0A8ZD76_ARUDO
MKSKFLKYWKNIPMLYAFAFFLDPRCKMKGFTNALQFLSQLTHIDYSTYLIEVHAELTNTFSKYESKFGEVRLQGPPPIASSGKKKNKGLGRNFWFS